MTQWRTFTFSIICPVRLNAFTKSLVRRHSPLNADSKSRCSYTSVMVVIGQLSYKSRSLRKPTDLDDQWEIIEILRSVTSHMNTFEIVLGVLEASNIDLNPRFSWSKVWIAVSDDGTFPSASAYTANPWTSIVSLASQNKVMVGYFVPL